MRRLCFRAYILLLVCLRAWTLHPIVIKQTKNTNWSKLGWHGPEVRLRFDETVVRILIGARFFYLLKNAHNGSEAHPPSYSIGTGVLSREYSGGAWSKPLTTLWCRGQEWVEFYPYSTHVSSWRGRGKVYINEILSDYWKVAYLQCKITRTGFYLMALSVGWHCSMRLHEKVYTEAILG